MSKNFTICLVTAILFHTLSFGQTVHWGDATIIKGSATVRVDKIAANPDGSVYVAGVFDGTVVLGVDTLRSKGGDDVFIAKYVNDKVVWSKHIGSIGDVNCSGIAADKNHSLYIVGNYEDTLSLGSSFLPSEGSVDMYMAKFDSSGVIEWAKNQGNSFRDEINAIDVSEDGDFFVAGRISSSNSTAQWVDYVFDNSDTIRTKGGMFYAKYKTNGSLVWAKMNGNNGTSASFPTDIVLDRAGNFAITGSFNGSYEYFDGQQVKSYNTGFVMGTSFTAKFDTSGSFKWVNVISASGNAGIAASKLLYSRIAVDSKGNIVKAGVYGNCDLIIYGGVSVKEIGGDDIYIVKYDSTGQLSWIKRAGGGSWDGVADVAVDYNDDIYITGLFNTTGGAIIGGDTLQYNAREDAYVAKYDANGNGSWGRTIKGASNDRGTDIETVDEDIIISGYFNSSTIDVDGQSYAGNGNAASWTSYLARMSVFPVSVGNVTSKKSLCRIYPNPTNGSITIDEIPTGATVVVMDMFGRVVANGSEQNRSCIIALSSYPIGNYVVKVISDGKLYYSSLIQKVD